MSLAAGGLTAQDDTTREWSLGPLAIALGSAAQRQISWLQSVNETVRALSSETRETMIFTMREQAYGTHVDIVESLNR